MTKTTNYQLNQWAKSDRVMMDDFNADNTKIDTALKANADAVALCGNCTIWTSSYTGTGHYGDFTLTFPQTPLVVIIIGMDGYALVTAPGTSKVYAPPSTMQYMTLVWGDKSLTWNPGNGASEQLNKAGTLYKVYALFVKA